MANDRPEWVKNGVYDEWIMKVGDRVEVVAYRAFGTWYASMEPLVNRGVPLRATTEADAKAEALAMARRVVAELADAIGRAG